MAQAPNCEWMLQRDSCWALRLQPVTTSTRTHCLGGGLRRSACRGRVPACGRARLGKRCPHPSASRNSSHLGPRESESEESISDIANFLPYSLSSHLFTENRDPKIQSKRNQRCQKKNQVCTLFYNNRGQMSWLSISWGPHLPFPLKFFLIYSILEMIPFPTSSSSAAY